MISLLRYLFLYLIKHHAMKMYGTVEVQFCACLILALELHGEFHFTLEKSLWYPLDWMLGGPRTDLDVMIKRIVCS
jgi:hypothetical protein